MKLPIILHDQAARPILRELAERYARLAIKSGLDIDTRSSPWSRKGETYGQWMRDIDKLRLAYKRSLQSIFDNLPEVPTPDWRPVSGSDGKPHAYYDSRLVDQTAEAYSKRLVADAELLGLFK